MNLKRVAKGHPASPFEAFRQLVYAVGAQELAGQMGLRPGTLYNKADADEDTHHQPILRDVVLATRLTGDNRVLDALDEMFGRAAFDVRPFETYSDEALLDLVAKLGVQKGEFFQALSTALQGGFSVENSNRLRAEAYDVISAVMEIVVRVEGLNDA